MLDSYKCSNCGGYMTFDASSGKLCCLGCRKEEVVENYQAQYEPYDCLEEIRLFQDDEARQYQCRQCASVIITDNHSAVSVCPFCGGQAAPGKRLSEESAPTYVLPFRISKREAERAYKKWRRKLIFSPRDFTRKQRKRELIGIYISAMCYDIRVQGEMDIGALRRKKTSTPEDVREEISCYRLYRKHDLLFRQVPVSNSKNISDGLLDQLSPYRFLEMEPFSPSHLTGFLTEKNARPPEETFSAGEKKAEKYTEQYITEALGDYQETSIDENDSQIGKSASRYILLPLWLAVYDQGGEEYIFAMNGQTGKVACEPPLSWIKIGAGAGLIALTAFLSLRIITVLLGGPLL